MAYKKGDQVVWRTQGFRRFKKVREQLSDYEIGQLPLARLRRLIQEFTEGPFEVGEVCRDGMIVLLFKGEVLFTGYSSEPRLFEAFQIMPAPKKAPT